MKRQKLKATAEKMEEKIRPFGTMLGIVATFLVALATALASFASRILRNVDVTLVLFAVVVLLAILCFLLMRRCSILNRKVKASYETVVESNRKFVDDFVKAYHCIEKGHKQRDEGKPNPTFINFLNTETRGFLQKATDELRASLDGYLGDSVCVCVKFLEPKRQVNDALDPNDAKTSTFARSGNTDVERIHATSEEPAPLAKNTDFRILVDERYRREVDPGGVYTDKSRYFYCANLEEFDEKLKQNGIEAGYENTRKSYKTFYRSAAVVPIKADMSIRFYHAEKADDIIGFLCADSKRVDVFTTDRAKVVLELMESYALLIYEVMNDYRYYLGKDISAVSRCNACEHDFKAREADCPSVSEAKKANPKINRRRRKK